MAKEIFFTAHVRIRVTPETKAAGVAGLEGEVFGETQPSSSGVSEIIGKLRSDYAISVYFEETDSQFWFSPDLIEVIDERPPRKPLFDWLKIFKK